MKKGKLGLGVFSVAALLVILLMAVHTVPTASADAAPVLIQLGAETVDIWTADGENYYAFLPGNTGEAQLLPGTAGVTLEGKALPRGSGDFAMNTPYELIWQEGSAQRRGTLQLMPSGGTATLFLDTQSGTMDYVHARKGNAERGRLRLYGEDGSLNYSGSLSSLRGRGNSTWVVHDKKPYALELTGEVDLLGMGAAKKWVLLADALDASALRNKLVYDFAAQLGMGFTPETRWTEVYLNGEYAGLYLLCERIESDPQRLDLSSDGSLVCMDRDLRVEEDTDPYFVTAAGQYLQIQEGSDIAALKEKFQAMEDAILFGTDDSWRNYIDLDSWVKKYLIEEVFGSYDAGFQSQYFYCYDLGETSKIYAGPVWDFDSSLGNPGVWALNSPRGLFAWRPQAAVDYAPSWYHSLYEKEAFREELKKVYRDEFLPLLKPLAEETVAACAARIAPAFERNRIRWNVETEGIQAEAAHITAYLIQRMEFLWEFLLEDSEYHIVRLQETQTGGYYGYYAVEPGTCFEDLPERADVGFLGWYREDTGEAFDPTQPVTEDLCLYPKYEGVTEEQPDDEASLKDVILRLYHYVPGAVLLLMGLILLPLGIRKGRGTKRKEKQGV